MRPSHVLACLFAVNYVSVALRVWQQLNVMNSEYMAIIPTSYGMAAMLVLTTLGVVSLGKSIKHQAIGVICIGTGGWWGSWTAIYSHSIIF